jgi:hypothetical protein
MALTAFSVTPARAQSDVGNAVGAPAQVQYAPDELERLRADLIAFVQAYREAAATVSPAQAQKFDGLDEQLKRLSAADLNVIRGGMPDTSVLGKATLRLNASVEKSTLNRVAGLRLGDGPVQALSPGFPGADYPSCGSTRVDDAVIDASDIALFVAEGVRDGASRLCGQVAVVAGFGANTSTACIISDAVYLTAKGVNYGLHYCNDKIDSAEQAATFGRLEHLHTDVESSITNDNANKAALATAIANSQSAIVANANSNTAALTATIGSTKTAIIANADANGLAIITNDNLNKTAIVANDNANKAAIVANDNANKNTIVANDNANTVMLRDLLLRTQIEADLASNDGAAPVALFETPETQCAGAAPLNQCGLLGLVRQIVVQTISRLAGSGAGQANSFLAKGDQYRTAGNYKAAYQQYRHAYKTAAK